MLLDAKYDSYTDQQLMAEASSFELGYAKTGCNIETAKELYYKAFSKFGNLYARNKWIQLKSELKGQEETVTREHNSDSHSYVITQQNNCYEDNIEREKFSNKVCEIFGIKSPGPVIWTQRKKLRDTYGYTDSAIIDCLEYIYNVLKLK